uniref:Uncharacterized protein n=1 Tax=Salix viminalis TaxID=40686 RepID=A0A6N2LSI4_SALVM
MDKMFGLNSFSYPQIPSFSRIPLLHSQPNLPPPFFPPKISKRTHPRFLLSAQTSSSSSPTQEPSEPAREMKNEFPITVVAPSRRTCDRKHPPNSDNASRPIHSSRKMKYYRISISQ